jgi:raffinose/stachyose/melibiose transport system substrate-binding protein
MRRISFALVISMVMLTFVGCGQKESTTVRFLNFNPEISSICEEIAREYENETGVKVEIETASESNYESTLMARLTTDEAPTIFRVNGFKGYDEWKEYCANLDGTDIEGILTDKSLALLTEDGVFGIPCAVEGYGIIYNEKILNEFFALPDRKSDIASVEEIKSFDDLKEVVKEMEENKDKLNIEGVFASTKLNDEEGLIWQTQLLNIPLYYELEREDIAPESDDTKKFSFKYSDNFKNIFDLCLNNSTADRQTLSSNLASNSMTEFAEGKCAMVQNGNCSWSMIKNANGRIVNDDDIKMMPIYTGITDEEKQGLCIGTENYLCINKKASPEQIVEAQKFLYWIFSSNKGKKYVSEAIGIIAPFNTFDKDEQPEDPLSKEVVKWMEKEGVNNVPWYFDVIPSQTFNSNFAENLLMYAQEKKTWDSVVDDTVDDWKKES